MGADIHGWVEARSPHDGRWDSIVLIDNLIYRRYGMFASLFGVRNGGSEVIQNGRFRAIAAGRGTPNNPSPHYIVERDLGSVGETWALWSELATIDWDEEGAEYIAIDPPYEVSVNPGPGRRRERRGDYRNGGWATLFKLMESLAEQFGAENVRLSVWFDQW